MIPLRVSRLAYSVLKSEAAAGEARRTWLCNRCRARESLELTAYRDEGSARPYLLAFSVDVGVGAGSSGSGGIGIGVGVGVC